MAAPDVCIRPARVGDAAALAQVHVASWRWAYRGLVPDDVLASLSWQERRDRWLERLGAADAVATDMRTWVVTAADDGSASSVVGFASFGPSRDDDTGPGVAEVYAIYLAQRWARRGLGTRLLRAGLEALPAHVDRVDVWVLRDNVRARAFYGRCALLPDGAEKVLSIGDVDLVEVRCTASRVDVEQRIVG